MNQKDRLIELKHNADIAFIKKSLELIDNTLYEDGVEKIISREEFFADYLIANGVIVPPVNVGHCVWFLQNDRVALGIVQSITILINSLHSHIYEMDEHNEIENEWDIPLCEIGKTVFLSREDAEKALKATHPIGPDDYPEIMRHFTEVE